MDRRTRTIVVLAVALVAATVASVSVYSAVKRIPVREVEVAHDFVVLAARPIPLGTRLAASDLKVVGWPSSSPLPGAFPRVDDVVGRGVITPLAANQPVTESTLAPREAGAGLSPAIPPGMRAISVKVNEVIGVAGFATPGARVDVLATVRHSTDTMTRVLVPNVPVLTAGTRYEQEQTRNAGPIPATVVTLMVTPEEAERIALAASEGQIALALRNPLDIDEPATAGARLAGLVDGQPAPAPARRSVPPRPPATPARPVPPPPPVEEPEAVPAAHEYIVEAIRAGKRSLEVVQ